MKIYFNRHYTSAPYVDFKTDPCFGIVYCGRDELLSIMMLHGGIVRSTVSSEERKSIYHNNMRNRIHEKQLFYDSFELDSFATSNAVLAWRDALVGNCLHHLLCLYQDDAAFAERAANIAGEYGVALNGHAFVDSARALYQWLEKSYGPPLTVEREVPFRFPRSNGQIVSGEIDLIYRTAAGDVLIDYKSYPGAVGHLTDPANAFYAGTYSGQLELYEEALRLAGRPIRDRLICYFSLGTMIRIRFN